MYLSNLQYYICLHNFPIYFRVFQDLPAPWILQSLNFLFASTIFTISFRVFSRLPVRLQHRPHGFSNLPIFYLPPQFLPFTSVFSRLPVHLRLRPHKFTNLSISYLPQHFYHLLPCIFKSSSLSPVFSADPTHLHVMTLLSSTWILRLRISSLR